MLEAGLEFADDIHRLLEAFTTLPSKLRPIHFGHDENMRSAANLVDDEGRFSTFVSRSLSGFFLLAPGITYSVRRARGRSTLCDCFFDVQPMLVKQFLIHMARAEPIFGFACALDEREHRNRVVSELGVGTTECWVGRDSQKYVPGFYWLTLLPAALAERHGVPLSVVEEVAQEHIEIEDGQHYFSFYEGPEDWRSASGVAELCRTLPGVFDVEKVKQELPSAKTFLELHVLLRKWK
ncbi:MAG: hypothetical protein JWO70_1664 [Betaproteobacteria bacterium]|nr:hypothetical protein [Betaproteobacteria bacterium]